MVKGHKRQSHEHRLDLAGEHKWSDSGQIIFIIIFIIGMLSDLLLLKISSSWQEIIPWYYRFIIFIIIFFIAGYFGQRSHRIIFKEERKKLVVIDKDVYSKIRHPMYFGSILTYLSFVILSMSIIAFLIFIIVLVFYYYISRYEEKILIEKLGDDYKKYIKKVPMLIPFIKLNRG